MGADLIGSSADGPRIQPGSRVTLHFSLILPDGQEIDSTRNGKPASFTMGDGSLLPGFEDVLLGKQAGFAEQILLPPADAFGEHNPANVQLIDRQRFAAMLNTSQEAAGLGVDAVQADQPAVADTQADSQTLEPGLVVSFQAPDGELPGVVVAVYDKTVKVDFNHPLSGKDIVFDVAITKVEDPDD
ncbi:MAG: peptidylprolyl isomerase [Pseudomonadota bacterium]